MKEVYKHLKKESLMINHHVGTHPYWKSNEGKFAVGYPARYYVSGIDLSHAAKFYKIIDRFVVIRVQEHNGWAGIGFTAFFPTLYYVMEVKDGKVINSWMAEFGNQWREGLKEIDQMIQHRIKP